jgi:pyruvate/oxaloacetate carboxyltransferase
MEQLEERRRRKDSYSMQERAERSLLAALWADVASKFLGKRGNEQKLMEKVNEKPSVRVR